MGEILGESIIPFGKFKGEKIKDIALTDEGLKYLDWVITIIKTPELKVELKKFLKQDRIKLQLERALGEDV